MGDNSEEQCLEPDSDGIQHAVDSSQSSRADSKPRYPSSGLYDIEELPNKKSKKQMDNPLDSVDGVNTAISEPISKSICHKGSDTYSDDELIYKKHSQPKRKSRIQNADSDSEDNSGEDKPTCNISYDEPDPFSIAHKNTIQQKTDSGSESDKSNSKPKTKTSNSKLSDESSDEDVFSIKHRKSRIQTMTSSDDDESNDGLPQSPEGVHKNAEQQARMKNKINNLKNKFHVLTKCRQREHVDIAESERLNAGNKLHSKSSDNSDEEIESIMEIKTNNRKQQLDSLCDPDTSDEEVGSHVGKSQPVKKKHTQKRSTKLISPKPQMSAKQAMDNMKKIRSESNRLLREKEVSLPYHRAKALSLKDIMSRRKPALMSNGKPMPLKMNEQQLKQYAQMLQERQKEMMVLCKSESDDEEPDESNDLKTKSDIKIVDGIENESNHLVDNKNSNMAIDSSISKEEDKDSNKGEEKGESENIEDTTQEVTKIAKDDNNVAIQDKHAGKESDIELNTDNHNQCDTIGSNLIDGDKTSENNILEMTNDDAFDGISNVNDSSTVNTEQESQLISLHYDSEKMTSEKAEDLSDSTHYANVYIKEKAKEDNEIGKDNKSIENGPISEMDSTDKDVHETSDNIEEFDDGFSDDEIDMQDIDRIIENADIISENQDVDSPLIIRKALSLRSKPKLTGAPGMVIDLDGTDAAQPKKLSGVELLKERFTYFAKLKTPQEIERAREKSTKPGTLRSKLKQELEDEIANQRSLEWSKRLEEEKQQHSEMNAVRGDDDDPDAEDDLDDIEKIEAKLAEIESEKVEESSESEEELVEDDMVIKDNPKKRNPLITDEAEESDCESEVDKINSNADGVDGEDEIENIEDEESSDEETSEEEVENEVHSKKGRILKAFEDSDEEDASKETNNIKSVIVPVEESNQITEATNSMNTQDDELPSAQFQKSVSEDIFASQDTDLAPTSSIEKHIMLTNKEFLPDIDKNSERYLEEMPVICETQAFDEAKFDDIVGMCSGSFSQPIATQPAPSTQTQVISDDVLALCTGQFYDNQFVTQVNEEKDVPEKEPAKKMDSSKNTADRNVLMSILDELDGPDFVEKPKKFFCSEKENIMSVGNMQKKRLVIDSDDEDLKPVEGNKKKRKKKRLQDRALQISDDEEDETLSEEESAEDDMSDLEDVGDVERLVEYDSEENEVEVQPQPMKKKRKATEFFEQEAELSSEDEWVGSGDEDEAGLDRMEREAGDDDKFNQARLQRELGEIHMRDVLDQDKRDVRLLQELLFEDGDLGTGHRQRKFRWRTEEGDEGTGAAGDEFGDTQEEEFESEEMWRKQRHEREIFLRRMQQKEGEANDTTQVIDRSALIKANLSRLRDGATPTENQTLESPAVMKPTKDIPSPVKKPFSLQQLNVRGSLLARGDSALARLGALAGDAGTRGTHTAGTRNFVFAAVSPTPDDQPKVTKRKKSSSNPGTPHMMKKLKTEDKHLSRSSLLDHMTA